MVMLILNHGNRRIYYYAKNQDYLYPWTLATDKGNVLEQLMLSGMNVARLNFSHDTYENQKKRIDKVKALRTKHHLPVACLLDTKLTRNPFKDI